MIKDKTDEQKIKEEQEQKNKLDALDVVLQNYSRYLQQTPNGEKLKIIKQISKVHPSLGKSLQDIYLKEYPYKLFFPTTLKVLKSKYPHNDDNEIIKIPEEEYEDYIGFMNKME